MRIPKFWWWRRECDPRGLATNTETGARRDRKHRASWSTRRLSVEPLEARRLLTAMALSDADQLMLELLNRARANPVAEALRYGITDLNQGLTPGTISTAAKPPLAPHQSLVDAAEAHTLWMLANNTFTHDGPAPGESFATRLSDAGYRYSSAGENIAWFGTTAGLPPIAEQVSTLFANLFQSPGHRKNILNPGFTEAGPGVSSGNFTSQGTTYHASMATQDFGSRTGNNFLTGVTFADRDSDAGFSIGEGLQGVVIMAVDTSSGTTYTTTSGPSGAYSLQVPPGRYDVQAAGPALGSPLRHANVAIAAANVKVDFVASSVWTQVTGADSEMCVKNQATSFHVLANDTASLGLDPQSLEVATVPRHGQAQVDPGTGVVTYLPAANFVGLDSFTYQVADLQGHVSTPTEVLIAVLDLTTHPWQNPQNCADVNGDEAVTPLDALILITKLNQSGAGPLATPSPGTAFPLPYLDVSGTSDLTATDVLMVIDTIDTGDFGSPAEGESDVSTTRSPDPSRIDSSPSFAGTSQTTFHLTAPVYVCNATGTGAFPGERVPTPAQGPPAPVANTSRGNATLLATRAMPGGRAPARSWTLGRDSWAEVEDGSRLSDLPGREA